MTNIYELNGRADPVDQASIWIAKIERGLTSQEEEALQKWFVENPANLPKLLDIARVWDKMDSLSQLASLFPIHPARQRLTNKYRLVVIMCASLLIMIAGGLLKTFFINMPIDDTNLIATKEEKVQIFRTEIGEQSTVALSDGSKLILNTNSMIKVLFTDSNRKLTLEYGEVYIQVAHNKSRPLQVHVGNKYVEVIGTVFNLKVNDDKQLELIVVEGQVFIAQNNEMNGYTEDKSNKLSHVNDSILLVSAGESVLWRDDYRELKHIETKDIDTMLSWREGNLIFHGESLESALAEITRYTPVEFILQDEELKYLRIVGLFRAGDVNGLLETFVNNFQISHEWVNNEKVILRQEE